MCKISCILFYNASRDISKAYRESQRVGHEMLFIARKLYQKCLRIGVVQSINFKVQQFKAQ